MLGDAGDEDIRIESKSKDGATKIVYCPCTIEQALHFLSEYPSAKIVAGATDVGVQFNKRVCQSEVWLDLNRVKSLVELSASDGILNAGARATWTDFEKLTKELVPQFYEIVSVFGSPQIRHVGTIGGNIVNASPIADSLPFLFVCDSELELTSRTGLRTVKIDEFFLGYKKLDLRPGELLTRIKIPMPSVASELRLYKVSRRRDLDISSFTGAIKLERKGNVIHNAMIAYGAVGPVVLRLKQTESFLNGRSLNLETMRQAGDIAVREIAPLADVRGGVEYRNQLAKNVLIKFYYETLGTHDRLPAAL
jgi:xanthine dehydrogenase small subunit